MKELIDLIFDVAIPEPNTGCWLWELDVSGDGYGRFNYRSQSVAAHRLAWSAVNGDIPPGMVVRHDCDQPLCVNPGHLRVGTHVDNMADRAKRGRGRWGSLSAEQIDRAIGMRRRKMTFPQIAVVLGTTVKTIERAIARRSEAQR